MNQEYKQALDRAIASTSFGNGEALNWSPTAWGDAAEIAEWASVEDNEWAVDYASRATGLDPGMVAVLLTAVSHDAFGWNEYAALQPPSHRVTRRRRLRQWFRLRPRRPRWPGVPAATAKDRAMAMSCWLPRRKRARWVELCEHFYVDWESVENRYAAYRRRHRVWFVIQLSVDFVQMFRRWVIGDESDTQDDPRFTR